MAFGVNLLERTGIVRIISFSFFIIVYYLIILLLSQFSDWYHCDFILLFLHSPLNFLSLDISLIYHMIRGQGTIKLYVVYNVLEVTSLCALLRDLMIEILICLFFSLYSTNLFELKK